MAERVKGLHGRRMPNGAGRPLTPVAAGCGTLDRMHYRAATQEIRTPIHRSQAHRCDVPHPRLVRKQGCPQPRAPGRPAAMWRGHSPAEGP